MRPQSGHTREPAGPASGFLALGIVSLALISCGSHAAGAQMKVDGPPEAVHIDADDVSLREALNALQAKFNLHYRSGDTLDTRVSGSFTGSLRRVVARLLNGYDFAMTISPQGIDLLVFRQNASANLVVAQAQPANPPRAPTAPVMTAQEANRYERGPSR